MMQLRSTGPLHGLCVLAVLGLAGAAVGCTEHRGHGLEGTQSLEVTLVSPADPGAIDRRLLDSQHTVVVNVRAKDADNELDPTFEKELKVYAQFLGTLTPDFARGSIATIQMRGGEAMSQSITLPVSVLGPTTLWIDDGSGINDEYVPGRVAGASPTLWYRDPFIRDLQTPRSETALDALTGSPLQDKQIAVRASRHGARGRLVLTSVFAQGYTVSDVSCADEAGRPPCTAQAYDHAMVFTFSAGRGSDGHVLEEGEAIDGFAGGLSEFNGLTEVGFPRTFTPDFKDANGDMVNDAIDRTRQPPPALLEVGWFGPLSSPNGRINFERNEAAPIEIRNGKVCQLDDDYLTYKQWKLDPAGVGGDCSQNDNVLNVITAGVVTSIDPATLVGKTLPKVVGVLRPVSIGSFNVWIIYPRRADDIVVP